MKHESSDERIRSYEQRLDVHGSEPAFNEDGVDLTQIRESLRRTPYERLLIVQNWVESLQSVRVVRGPR
jgi:murein tripeptide amidase MpaA